MSGELKSCKARDLSWLFPESCRPLPANNPDCPYQIGDKLRFTPTTYSAAGGFGAQTLDVQTTVTGRVILINGEHRFYRVEYKLPGCIGHECFKY